LELNSKTYAFTGRNKTQRNKSSVFIIKKQLMMLKALEVLKALEALGLILSTTKKWYFSETRSMFITLYYYELKMDQRP
jgi:hypothetical protein